MTIKDIFEKNAIDKGWLGASDVINNAQYATIWSMIDATCLEYAKLMCDKQKQICADNAECTNNFFEVNVWSIINSPYPEELT